MGIMEMCEIVVPVCLFLCQKKPNFSPAKPDQENEFESLRLERRRRFI